MTSEATLFTVNIGPAFILGYPVHPTKKEGGEKVSSRFWILGCSILYCFDQFCNKGHDFLPHKPLEVLQITHNSKFISELSSILVRITEFFLLLKDDVDKIISKKGNTFILLYFKIIL